MPGRKFAQGNSYRYGFNGKENDNEVKGEGNHQDYGMRIYDTRIGKFLSVDPLTAEYPMLTPYQFASNRPMDGVDQDGLEWKPVTGADGNITDYTWSGFNADGSPVAGTKSEGNVTNNGTTYNYGSISVGNFHVGTFSVDDGTNIRGHSMISGNSASFSFDEVDENERSINTAFESGYLGNATGASGQTIASNIDSKLKDYEFANQPRLPDPSLGDGFLPGDFLLGGGLLKAAGTVVLKKVVTKAIIKKSAETKAVSTIIIRQTRDGSKAINIVRPSGRIKDISKNRVKEYVPDSRNPSGKPSQVNFKKSGSPRGTKPLSTDPKKRTLNKKETKLIEKINS